MTDPTHGAVAWVRTTEAPRLPPPPGEVGLRAWIWNNMFASMANFSSPGAAVQSIAMAVLTIVVAWFGLSQLYGLLDFALFSAVWSGPEGVKREACSPAAAGGLMPDGWFGACYPFVSARWTYFTYGFYPSEEIWRVNAVFLVGAIGAAWLVSDAVPARRIVGLALIGAGLALALFVSEAFGEPFGRRVGAQILVAVGALYLVLPAVAPRKIVAILMVTAFPLFAFVMLTGGGLDVARDDLVFWGAIAAGLLGLGFAGANGMLGEIGRAFGGLGLAFGGVVALVVVCMIVASVDFGLVTVPTDQWGGLLVTLVVAISGIVFSLPLGVLLALGRRSSLPAVRLLSIFFIEFWRGVPLITVLFMSSVMLPFFLPDGVTFNKLVRALIGVTLFSAAYQAEVVRGGLQAIPKGQYEGAMAVGLSYWKMMRLIVLPQALVLVIPGIVNTFIGLFKDTTLVLIISLFDLLGTVQSSLADSSWATGVTASTGYLTAGVIFFVFCFGISRYSMYLETKLRKARSR